VIFDGSDIIHIVKDPARGYGYLQADKLFEWHLPFILKGTAAKRFTEMAFHRCRLTSFSQEESGKKYDCDKTYFFLDRPADSLLVVPSETLARDEILLQNGNRAEDIPAEMTSEEVFLNANIPYLAIDSNADANSSAASLEKLKELKATSSYAIVPKDIAAKTRQELLGIGYKIKEVETKSDIPYIWQATGLKSVIYLSEDVTNLDPYVADVKDAKIFSELLIRGSGSDEKEASDRLKSLTILLESGSLPIPVESISKETISPWLGKEFLRQAAMMGLAALFVVAIVIFIRYRQLKLVLPIMSTALFEALLVLGFAALIHWNLDLASVAGIIAAIGTGVNDQIVITDELLKGGIDATSGGSLANRAKRAFFIVVAAASTALATLMPIIVLGTGLGKLVGFAITTAVGVLGGVFITRPAFGEFAKYLLQKK
jgi:preprotein translocase subunit SecD